MSYLPAKDTCITLLLALIPSILALVVGDRLYVGKAYYYYLLAPAASLGLCAGAFAPKPFLTGCALGFMTLSLLAVYPNLGSHSGNPFAGVFHVVGVVGGTTLAVASGIALRLREGSKTHRRTQAFCVGLAAYLVGAFIAILLFLSF